VGEKYQYLSPVLPLVWFSCLSSLLSFLLDLFLLARLDFKFHRLGLLTTSLWTSMESFIIITKGRYVFSWGGRAGASEGRVISESEHQRGGPYLM